MFVVKLDVFEGPVFLGVGGEDDVEVDAGVAAVGIAADEIAAGGSEGGLPAESVGVVLGSDFATDFGET